MLIWSAEREATKQTDDSNVDDVDRVLLPLTNALLKAVRVRVIMGIDRDEDMGDTEEIPPPYTPQLDAPTQLDAPPSAPLSVPLASALAAQVTAKTKNQKRADRRRAKRLAEFNALIANSSQFEVDQIEKIRRKEKNWNRAQRRRKKKKGVEEDASEPRRSAAAAAAAGGGAEDQSDVRAAA